MTLKNLISNGWFQVSFMVVVLWGIMNVTFRLSASILDVNYIVFTCSLFLSSSFVLILLGGPGQLIKETMRSTDTWFYGVVLLLLYLLNLYLFNLVTSTEGTILQRFSMVVSLLIGWFFLNRKFNLTQLIGAFIVSIGVALICLGIPEQETGTLYTIILLSAILQASQIFAAELHKPHKKATESYSDPKAKLRVVGFVMFITSTLFFFITFLLALTQGIHATENQIMADLPVLKDFLHTASIISGLIVGIIIVAPIKVLEFSGAQKINANNFLAICCLAPAATLFWEWSTASLTGLSLREFSSTDLLAGVAVTIGGFIVALGAFHKKDINQTLEEFLTYSTQDLDLVDDSREIVANTLEHFNSDIEKTAQALDVPTSVIEALMQDREKVLAFKDKVLTDVTRRYRRNVASNDPLTGLINRSGFMSEVKIAPTKSNSFCVLFIDLDKFKPVNDTYGHEAGDFILIEVAKRLKTLFPNNASITRLGGDEYCLLLLDTEKQDIEHLITKIKEALTIPFTYNEHTITIGGSVGLAHYPSDTKTPEDLLKIADEGMYREKKER